MAKNIAEIKNKQEARRQKASAQERLTNWYMINMTWGFVGIIILQMINRNFAQLTLWSTEHSLALNLTLWILAGVLFLAGGALFYLWMKDGRVKDKFFAYSVFAWIAMVVTLLFSFAPQFGPSLFWAGPVIEGFPTPQPRTMSMVLFNVGIFAALSGGFLLALWLKGGKEKKRLLNYSIFMWIVALGSFFIAFFERVRNFLESMRILDVFHIDAPQRFIWALMILIGAWLLGALVWYIIKYRKI